MTEHGRCGRHQTYDLSCDEFDWLLVRCDGQCEHCGVLEFETPHRQLHIDHDARVGWHAVRGMLCSRCNTNLDRGLLAADTAAAYLANPWWMDPRVVAGRAERARRTDEKRMTLAGLAQFKARAWTDAQRAARDTAILAAAADGIRQIDIAEAVGLSQSRVQVLARQARR